MIFHVDQIHLTDVMLKLSEVVLILELYPVQLLLHFFDLVLFLLIIAYQESRYDISHLGFVLESVVHEMPVVEKEPQMILDLDLVCYLLSASKS